MEYISGTTKTNKPIELIELEALLALLEYADIEQINPAHHNQIIRLCNGKLKAISAQFK